MLQLNRSNFFFITYIVSNYVGVILQQRVVVITNFLAFFRQVLKLF
jgi:hypothetical protein